MKKPGKGKADMPEKPSDKYDKPGKGQKAAPWAFKKKKGG